MTGTELLIVLGAGVLLTLAGFVALCRAARRAVSAPPAKGRLPWP